MKRIAGCLILLMVLASPQAISKTITFVCNGCNPAEKRVLAVESGAGDYFIFDVVNRNLVHWHVNQNTTAQLLSLSSDQQFLYNAVQSFYDTTGTLDISGYVDLSIERPNSITLIPGIGKLSARILYSAIIDERRFDNSKCLANYGALTPTIHQSGETLQLGKINRDGRGEVRRSLLQCAHAVARTKSSGVKPLKEFFERIEKRRGKKRTIVALARKLLTTVYGVLKSGEVYNPAKLKAA